MMSYYQSLLYLLRDSESLIFSGIALASADGSTEHLELQDPVRNETEKIKVQIEVRICMH